VANRNAAFYGHFSLKEGFSLKITLRGWGASALRANLSFISLQTGNFAGNSASGIT